MTKEFKTYQFESEYGGTYQLRPRIAQYAQNNNLYLGFDYFDEEFQSWEPYCDATVNVGSLPYLCSAVDSNNNEPRFLAFLESNGFGNNTGLPMFSGYCTFPVFMFDPDKLKEIDPQAFTEYQKANGVEEKKPPLSEKIAEAEAKTPTPGKDQQGKEAQR